MTEKPRETQAESHVVELKEKVNNSSLMKHRNLAVPVHRGATARAGPLKALARVLLLLIDHSGVLVQIGLSER